MRKKWILIMLASAGLCRAELPVFETKFNKAALDTVVQYADQGRPDAQLEIAFRYYAGHHVKKNDVQAFSWASKSAEQGFVPAMEWVSRMYEEGVGVASDPDKAEEWFIKALAVDPENPQLKENFKRLSDMKGASGDNRAFLKHCADAGYAPAYICLYSPSAVKLYSEGKYEKALSLFVTLSDLGDADSTCYLAKMYATGQGSLPQDDVEAFVLYQKAAEAGNVEAQYELARRYDAGIGISADPEQARIWYRRAAENGNAEAQFQFAEFEFSAAVVAESLVSSGAGDIDSRRFKNQYEKRLDSAIYWYSEAADKNHAGALYMMGRLYASGEGYRQDFNMAFRCYERAADLGCAEAVFYLGLMYHAGLGVEKDVSQAVTLYKKAADAGVTGALFYLGNGYRFGEGVDRNLPEGEGIYYGKMLKGLLPAFGNRKEEAVAPADVWVYRAAREYAVILWNRSLLRKKQPSTAVTWAGIAAQNGDPLAADILFRMNHRGLKSYRTGERDRHYTELTETPVEPRVDAVERRRIQSAFPYVLRPLDELYEKSDVQQDIISVDVKDGYSKNIAGDDLVELSVKYKTPARRSAMDYNGVMLMGIELTDKKEGRKYWAFSENRMESLEYTEPAYYDVSMVVDVSSYSNAKVTGWAVVYGCLLDDGVTLAVFDETSKSKKNGDLTMLFVNNQYSTVLDVVTVSTLDLRATVGEGSDSGLDRSDVMDLILGN